MSAACTKTNSDEPAEAATAAPATPRAADSPLAQRASAEDLVGQPAPPWQVGEWAGADPTALHDLRGQVVFVRFWTNTCPYCERSMPAIQRLAVEFDGRPVFFVGLYHSKPFGSERPWKPAVALARQWGVTFPVAYDRQWKTVRSWWLDTARRSATSASFVIGADGRFVYVHPGPAFYPSDDPSEAAQNRDYDAVRAAIQLALDAQKTADPGENR